MKTSRHVTVSSSSYLTVLLATGAFCLCAGVAPRAQAAFIVTPNTAATTPGNTDNGLPFSAGTFSQTSERYQQLYTASFFSAVPVTGAFITDLSFRLGVPVADTAFSATLPSIRIDLETTSIADDTLSTTFASNVNATDRIVYGGTTGSSLALSSTNTTVPGGTTKTFDIVIHLSTPFFYVPALGNLLLDVRNFGGGTTTFFDAVNTSGDGVSRVFTYGEGVTSATGTADSIGLITGFTTSAVPEPSTWATLLGGLTFFGMAGWMRRNRHV